MQLLIKAKLFYSAFMQCKVLEMAGRHWCVALHDLMVFIFLTSKMDDLDPQEVSVS